MNSDELAAALRAEDWCRMATPTADGVVVRAELTASFQVEGDEDTVADVKKAMAECMAAAVRAGFGEEAMPPAPGVAEEVVVKCGDCLCYVDGECRRGLPQTFVATPGRYDPDRGWVEAEFVTHWPWPNKGQGCAEGVPR